MNFWNKIKTALLFLLRRSKLAAEETVVEVAPVVEAVTVTALEAEVTLTFPLAGPLVNPAIASAAAKLEAEIVKEMGGLPPSPTTTPTK